MMTHVPIFAHGNAREVLIVGGGDCGIAEEVLKHKSVKRLTQVEIDASVVEFSKEHFPEFTKPVLSDKRFDLVIDDGMNYVAKTDRRFDVIIVDSTDPLGPGKVLFSQKFYAACKRCMAKGGVMVTQNGVPILQAGELTSAIGKFRKLFADGYCYVAAIPTYVGGHMAMGWATDNPNCASPVKTIAERYRKAGSFKTKYWTPEVHVAAFALPRFIAEKVAKAKRWPGVTGAAVCSRPLVRDVEIELDQDVVGIVEENLPARAVRHLVDPERPAFLREMLLHRLEAAAAEGDVVDDARIRPLLLVGRRMSLRCSTGWPSL